MSVTIKNKVINGIPHLWDEETRTYYPTVKEDKETGLTYTLDPETFTYLPNLTVTVDERDIGIWGYRRKKFLQEHKEPVYLEMFDSHTLTDHLIEINAAAETMMDTLREKMMEQEGVNEKLKAEDWMEWVRRTNSIENRAEEIVLNSLICV